MKEWNNPQLFSLGIENTFEDNIHYCHSEGKYHLNGCGHSRNNQHQTSDHPAHNWDGNPHVSKCCCTPS